MKTITTISLQHQVCCIVHSASIIVAAYMKGSAKVMYCVHQQNSSPLYTPSFTCAHIIGVTAVITHMYIHVYKYLE